MSEWWEQYDTTDLPDAEGRARMLIRQRGGPNAGADDAWMNQYEAANLPEPVKEKGWMEDYLDHVKHGWAGSIVQNIGAAEAMAAAEGSGDGDLLAQVFQDDQDRAKAARIVDLVARSTKLEAEGDADGAKILRDSAEKERQNLPASVVERLGVGWQMYNPVAMAKGIGGLYGERGIGGGSKELLMTLLADPELLGVSAMNAGKLASLSGAARTGIAASEMGALGTANTSAREGIRNDVGGALGAAAGVGTTAAILTPGAYRFARDVTKQVHGGALDAVDTFKGVMGDRDVATSVVDGGLESEFGASVSRADAAKNGYVFAPLGKGAEAFLDIAGENTDVGYRLREAAPSMRVVDSGGKKHVLVKSEEAQALGQAAALEGQILEMKGMGMPVVQMVGQLKRTIDNSIARSAKNVVTETKAARRSAPKPAKKIVEAPAKTLGEEVATTRARVKGFGPPKPAEGASHTAITLTKEEYARIGDYWSDIKEEIPGVKIRDEVVKVPNASVERFNQLIGRKGFSPENPAPVPGGFTGGRNTSVGAMETPAESLYSTNRSWSELLGENATSVAGALKFAGNTVKDIFAERRLDTQAMKEASRGSETLAELRRKLMPEEGVLDETGGTHARQQALAGPMMARLTNLLQPVMKIGGFLGEDSNKRIFLKMTGSNPGGLTAEEAAAASGLRSLLNDAYGKFAKGIEKTKPYIDNYFPMRLQLKNIAARRGDAERVFVKRILEAHPEMTERGALKIVQDVLDSAAENDGWIHVPDYLSETKAGHLENSRKFFSLFTPDESTLPFIDHNIAGLMRHYIFEGARKTEYGNVWGKKNGDAMKMLKKIQAELEDPSAGVNKHIAGPVLKQLRDLHDDMTGTRIKSASGRSAYNTITAVTAATTIPLAIIPSLSEIAWPMLLNAKSYPSALGHAVFNYLPRRIAGIVAPKLSEGEWARLGEMSGRIMDEAIAESYMHAAAGGGMPKQFKNIFYKMNGLTELGRFTRVIAAKSGFEALKDSARVLVEGGEAVEVNRARSLIDELGLDRAEAAQWYREGANPYSGLGEKLEIPAKVGRLIDKVVMNPTQLTKPAWHTHPLLGLAAMFQGYTTTFGNTLIKGVYKKAVREGFRNGGVHGGRMAGAAIGALAISYGGILLKDWLADKAGMKPTKRSDEEMAYTTLNRAGMFGGYTQLLDVLSSGKYGRDPLVAASGPVFSKANDIARGGWEAVSKGSMDPLNKAVARSAVGNYRHIFGQEAYDDVLRQGPLDSAYDAVEELVED